jgi:hypothetical protein
LRRRGCAQADLFPGRPRQFWEADDAARNLLAGKIESSRMTHATSIAGMKIFDEIRAQSRFKYSDELERVL